MPSKRGAGKPAKPFTFASKPLTIQAASGEGESKKLGTFTGNAYTGEVMRPGGWADMIVDLDGVEIPAQQRPVLRQHDHEQIVGHTTSVSITASGIEIAGVFSGQTEHVEKVTHPARNGFAWQLSIGADPVSTEFLEAGQEAEVNGRTITGPITISRKTILGEISFVPLGADGHTSATVTASASKRKGSYMFARNALKLARKDGIKAALKFSDDEIDAMSDDEAKAALKECMKADGDKDETPKDDDKGTEASEDDPDNDGDKDKKTEASRRSHLAAMRKETANELRRVSAITAAVRQHNVDTVVIDGKRVNLAAHAIECGWSADKAELHAMRAARPSAGVGNGPTAYSTSPAQITDAVLECAVLQASGRQFQLDNDEFYSDTVDNGRAVRRVDNYTQRKVKAELSQRYTDKVQQTAKDLFRERAGLQQILVAGARANGYRGTEVLRDTGDIENVLRASNWGGSSRIEADGTSTANIGNVVANVMNKFLLQGYLFTEQAWKEIAGIRPVNDFKPTKSVNLFGDFIFEKVADSGELKNATLQDQAFANQADQYGKILTIGRKNIINDDLGALTTTPMLMGRGAGLKLNATFWAMWLDTTQKDDGGSTAFWAATHTIPNQLANGNYISGGGSALSSTSLQTAKQTYDKQIDPNGYPLGVDVEYLLYPPELDSTAWELLNSTNLVYGGGSAAKQPADNRWKNRFKPVMSRYLSNSAFTGYSATAWWLLANPALIPVIECCFLGGQEAPTVQQAGPEYQFNTLGISIRGVFDFGVAMQNFRGGVKSAGA